MFKFSFKNTPTNILVSNHISKMKIIFDTQKVIIDSEHLNFFFPWEFFLKKIEAFGFQIKTNKTCIATQISGLQSYYIQVFINSFSWPIK